MSREPQLFRINPSTREAEALQEVEFAQLGFQERRDIQEWVAANPGIISEDLLIIAKEFSGFDRTSERLDLLAVDVRGRLIVIELKRDDTGVDAYWQAIKYASYLRRASKDEIIGMLARHEEVTESEAGERLLAHLDADDLDSLNNDQQIILASHRFAPEVTSAALWLNEKVPGESLVTCVKLTPYRDEETGSLYLQANTIIPVPGEDDYAIQIGHRQVEAGATGFAENLRRTYGRNKNDAVTRFLKAIADRATESLDGAVKPDRQSRWAGGWAGGAYDHRYYRVWYSREPWKNWGMSYSMNLYLEDDKPSLRMVDVVLGYYSGELARRISALEVPEDEASKGDTFISVTHTSEALDDAFADTIANSLRRFIEAYTPVVDEFEDERNQEEA